jgi:hypothetical protein
MGKTTEEEEWVRRIAIPSILRLASRARAMVSGPQRDDDGGALIADNELARLYRTAARRSRRTWLGQAILVAS